MPDMKSALLYGGVAIFHPFRGFYELKYEKRGSFKASLVFLALYFISVVIEETCTGYIFASGEGRKFSLFVCLLKAVTPVLLFALSNWCLTLSLNGEGTLTQLVTAMCYALIPLTIKNFLVTALSNFFSSDEALYMQLITAIALLWTGFLLLAAVMQTNQYSFARAVASSLLSIVVIGVILLIILLCFDLVGQTVDFVVSIFKELSYR